MPEKISFILWMRYYRQTMSKRPHFSTRTSHKPSKLIMLFALFIAFSLPYFLVKHFARHKKYPITPPATTQTTTINEAAQALEPSSPVDNKPKQTTKVDEATSKQATTPLAPPVKPMVKKVQENPIKDNVWLHLNPKPGDSMAAIFHRLGLSATNLHQVVQKNPYSKALTAIKPSQTLKFMVNKGKLEKLVVPVNDIQVLTISRVGNTYKSKLKSKKMKVKNHYVTAKVQGSLYLSAAKVHIPYKLVKEMTQVLKQEVDFSRALHTGDQFSMVYETYYVKNKLVSIGNLLAVSYTSNGKKVQAIRHTDAHGGFDYYSPKGDSFKKAYTRYPLHFSHISSTFALSRYHPILHYRRAHKGIDLAAPIGTPIQTIGDGVVTEIDRHHGYGNMIKIKHDGTYSTIYAHMLKFQRGLSKGSRVKKGQVIGFVGQTGLASGPHCHFELHVNNQPRNPTTTKIPIASPVPAREMRAFKAKAQTLLSRLNTLEKTANKKKH
jgi:murein DD-endopeptidase MepM/ murein hydrolase activator NlpD